MQAVTKAATGVAALVFGLTALTACQASTSGKGFTSTGSTFGPPPTSAQSCAIYERGNDARIAVTAATIGNECTTLATDLSAGGQFWTSQYQQPQEPPLSLVCIMTNGGYTAQVDDDGGQVDGQTVCSGFVQSGWTENLAAEDAQRVAASASASASAAAQQTQQQINQNAAALGHAYGVISADESSLKADLTALAGDLASASRDVQTAYTDERTVLSDAQTASNNQDGTTCGDASSVAADASGVASDAGGLDGDVQGLGNDLGTMRTDTTNLEAAVAVVQQEIPGFNGGASLPSPGEVQLAVSAAGALTAKVVSDTNADIDQMNADVTAAYQHAATASAANNCGAASTPPSPLAHIR